MMQGNDTMLVQLTVEELISLLKKEFPVLSSDVNPKIVKRSKDEGSLFTGRLVYGLRGIRDLFGVSHRTAYYWKESWLKPAVIQRGRKIIVDAEYAMKLFDDYQKASK